MTGLFVRVRRDDGRIQTVEIEELSDTELERFIEQQPANTGWSWASALAQWIRENVALESQES